MNTATSYPKICFIWTLWHPAVFAVFPCTLSRSTIRY